MKEEQRVKVRCAGCRNTMDRPKEKENEQCILCGNKVDVIENYNKINN